jgi:hypothetical protein
MMPGFRSLVVVVAALLAASASCERATAFEPSPPVVVSPGPKAAAADPIDAARREARRRLDAGDLEGALVTIVAALPSADDHGDDANALRCDHAALLSRRAVATTDLHARERDLRDAVRACPGETSLTRGLADTLHGRARAVDDDAVRLGFLKESIALQPTPAALVDLALLHERQDDPTAALEAAIQAERIAAGDARVTALKERLARTASVEQTFKSARHSHFVARFEGHAEERLAWSALDTLEQAYFRVGKALDLHPVERVTVVIYTGEQYRQATNGPDWSTGLFDGKIRVREGQLAADKGTLDDTLVHEYVHAALHTLPVKVPPWFHEGLAQHFEAGRPPPVRVMARTGVAPREALDIPFTQLPPDVVPAAYATAHAVVVRMVERRGQWGLHQLIAELKGGRDFNDAVQRAFAVDVDTLHREAVDPEP